MHSGVRIRGKVTIEEEVGYYVTFSLGVQRLEGLR